MTNIIAHAGPHHGGLQKMIIHFLNQPDHQAALFAVILLLIGVTMLCLPPKEER